MGLPYWTTPSSPPKPTSSPSAASSSSPSATTPRFPIRRSLPPLSSRPRYRSRVSGVPASTDDLIAQTAALGARIRRTEEGIAARLSDLAQRRATLITGNGSSIAVPTADAETGDMMESLGRYVARTHSQRTAAMEAGRRAYRDSVGIENPASDEGDNDTPILPRIIIRDPLTWTTRDDGSVIPPSMESSQPREQPQPFLSDTDTMDFTFRTAELERTRRELETRYEARLANLRAAEPRIAQRERLRGMAQEQRGRERDNRQRRAELRRERDAEISVAAMVQPRSRGNSNMGRNLPRQRQRQHQPIGGTVRTSTLPSLTDTARTGGLGDRERSLSPENDNAWHTLLTTISPDPQPPSASSSFRSATTAAAASAGSSSFGARSQDTSAATSFAVDGDDFDENSEAEPAARRGPSRFFEHICETFESRGSENEEDGNGELRSRIQAEASTLDIFWRDYTSVVIRRAERVARVASVGGEESGSTGANRAFDGMQRIVQGLVAREDIPDEWWATAGLARIVAREEE